MLRDGTALSAAGRRTTTWFPVETGAAFALLAPGATAGAGGRLSVAYLPTPSRHIGGSSPRARATVQLLPLSILDRVQSSYLDVIPRALMDDISFQWVGEDARQEASLFKAAKWFADLVSPLTASSFRLARVDASPAPAKPRERCVVLLVRRSSKLLEICATLVMNWLEASCVEFRSGSGFLTILLGGSPQSADAWLKWEGSCIMAYWTSAGSCCRG